MPLEPVTTREISEALLPHVFPVPCKEQFTMQFPGEALSFSSTLEIYDVLGRMERQEVIHSRAQTFAAPQSKGVYFLRIRDKNGFRHAGRIVVD